MISLASLAKTTVCTLALAALAACSHLPGTMVGDARPHAGVDAARRMPVHGVDVSKWQGRIDWASVAAAGNRFAYLKATEGGDHVDERFAENWTGAAAAGLARGAYHFTSWCRPVREQAAWFRKVVPADPAALAPVLDVEWNPSSKACPGKVSKEQALAMIGEMLKAMEAHTGRRPVIYTDVTFHKDVLEGELPDHEHWVRSTASDPAERYVGRPWTLWQYTTTGRVPGIVGNVDRNVFNGTEAQWASFRERGCGTPNRACPGDMGKTSGDVWIAHRPPSSSRFTTGS